MEFNGNVNVQTLNNNLPCRKKSGLPNHFDDDFLESIIKHVDFNGELDAISIPVVPDFLKVPIYPLSLGLLVKLRKALKRLVKRKIVSEPQNQNYSLPLYIVSSILTDNHDILKRWTPNQLEHAACLLEEKCKVLSGYLFTLLDVEPLFPPLTKDLLETHFSNLNSKLSNGVASLSENIDTNEHIVLFRKSFINKVNEYHASVKRPNIHAKEIFDCERELSATATVTPTVTIEEEEELTNEVELIVALSKLSREVCSVCGSKRQIYCGDCGGVRMLSTVGILPERVTLPFDVLLLVHWQESLHKCTGIHTRVMAMEDQVSYEHWEKNAWHSLVASLDGDRDLLLFPSEDACDVNDFPWNAPLDENDTSGTSNAKFVANRYRVVVLESNWKYGQGMARQIADYRKSLGLKPLRCIKLTNIVGKYWKFHEKGHSAISTIEAIKHTVTSVLQISQTQLGIPNNEPIITDSYIENMKVLLLLFEIERYRVLKAVNEDGKKPPRAMLVVGTGDSSWENICVYDDHNASGLVEYENKNDVPEAIDYNFIYLNRT